MVDTPPKPASRGGTSRLRVAGRLAALAGLPLLVIFLIFASGVYCGASRSYRVQTLEAKWLGLDGPESDAAAGGAAEPTSGETPDQVTAEPDTGDSSGGTSGSEQPQPEQPDPSLTEVGTDTGDEPEPPPTIDPPTTEPAASVSGLLTATAEPVGSELRSRFDETRVVRVKVLVDPALVIARDDWLSYIAELVDATHASFEVLFGVDVQLHGVVIWDLATDANVDALLAALTEHDREGADVILGMLARPRPQGFEPTRWVGAEHGDHALVFADLAQTDRFYRNMLRALAGLLGAEPVSQAESFMSDTAPPPGAAPILDPDNRGKVVFNKRRPFASSATPGDGTDEPESKPGERKPNKPKPKPAAKPEPSEQP
ncbi:hypothetical protein [Enhygromyxa salina]|uniref:Uncharacterized protein n=1 Tax=Enhygromyxa salina TaxID=215803 RepID=A0A2S9XU64_9BACT|nr:hypothetical protein [Enhygromyxa salina]PRP96374.1 hypothetical protein ENSA7_71890 [Enhygromyxa salina]